ncbi:MAG: serine/threonine protein kinase [Nannocystaceae bacterium]|nr:serine/threonine protein kinase [Nannocystaceae bacterium]
MDSQSQASPPTEVGVEVAAVAPARAAGTVLADRYRLIRCIGRGGMGEVWAAEQLALGSRVAIKLIDPRWVDDDRARARFQREAQAAASLHSPHVVQVFDHGLHEGVPFIAMELLEGETLAARLTRVGRLPPARVLALVTEVGGAIGRAHAAGLVHRDLKPENIFLVPTGTGEIAKVLDFGIAKRTGDTGAGATTQVGGIIGTPHYMSPERLVDPASADATGDLWSLAVIAYECLVGRRPFAAGSVAELAVAVLAEAAPVPSQHAAVPAGFDAWFARATAREASARFGDAPAMIAALTSALTAGPSRSRHGWLIVSVIAAAALVAIALASAREPEPAVAREPAAAAPAPAPIAAPPQPQRATVPAPAKVIAAEPTAAASTAPPSPQREPKAEPRRERVRSPARESKAVHDTAELEP